MLGALAGVTVFNLATGAVSFPAWVTVFTQILAGGFIGMSITREIVLSLRGLIKPALLLCGGMILLGLIIGFALYAVSGFNLATCLLCAAPGGMSDIALISGSMGGDQSKVVGMHLVRLISVIGIYPVINRILLKRHIAAGQAAGAPGPGHTAAGLPSGVKPPSLYPAGAAWPVKAWWLARKNGLTVALAAAGGVAGYFLGIPAGTLVFAMAAVGALNILTGKGYMSAPVRRFSQMLAGAMIAQSIGMAELSGMGGIALPAFVLVMIYLAGSQLIAYLMYRRFRVNRMTALFASAPAGASDMALLAADLGGNTPVIAMLHVTRLVSVISIFPQLIFLILRWFGGGWTP
jgi:membrane AbrB-like protein